MLFLGLPPDPHREADYWLDFYSKCLDFYSKRWCEPDFGFHVLRIQPQSARAPCSVCALSIVFMTFLASTSCASSAPRCRRLPRLLPYRGGASATAPRFGTSPTTNPHPPTPFTHAINIYSILLKQPMRFQVILCRIHHRSIKMTSLNKVIDMLSHDDEIDIKNVENIISDAITEYDEQIADLSTAVEQKQQENERLQEEIKGLTDNLMNVTQELAEAKNKVDELTTKLEATTEVITKRIKRFQELIGKTEDIPEDVTSITKMLVDLEAEFDNTFTMLRKSEPPQSELNTMLKLSKLAEYKL